MAPAAFFFGLFFLLRGCGWLLSVVLFLADRNRSPRLRAAMTTRTCAVGFIETPVTDGGSEVKTHTHTKRRRATHTHTCPNSGAAIPGGGGHGPGQVIQLFVGLDANNGGSNGPHNGTADAGCDGRCWDLDLAT